MEKAQHGFRSRRSLVACFLLVLGSIARTQTGSKEATPSNQVTPAGTETTVDGCLYGGPTEFELSDANGNVYSLHGQNSALQKYVGEEISVQGIEREERDRMYSVNVVSVKEVFKAPKPRLSESITDRSNWHTQSSEKYGVKFGVPTFPQATMADVEGLWSNFVAEPWTVALASVGIPREIYPETNFVGGAFLLSVNPQITNRESCDKFGTSDERFLSSRVISGIRYSEMTVGDAAAGTGYDSFYFHTFQHGLCYEVAFRFGGYNTSTQDLGCRVPIVDEQDRTRVIDEFMGRISFSRPESGSRQVLELTQIPTVISFTASSDVADDAKNRSSITFSWSTKNADYVEFSYDCSVVGLGVVILEGGGGSRNCRNDPKPISPDPREFTHAPNSTTDTAFGNSSQEDPISIAVTITPFSHGTAYPAASKSITISVDPFNPFPKGIPSSTANIALTYSGTPRKSHEQGSSLTVNWTDTLSRDSCVNLFLVQDSGNGLQYVGRVSRECLQPATAGSYTWTIPSKYSGSGFRIYAAAPGLTSSALGPVFGIVQSGQQDRLNK
jgi:hypothetical protein